MSLSIYKKAIALANPGDLKFSKDVSDILIKVMKGIKETYKSDKSIKTISNGNETICKDIMRYIKRDRVSSSEKQLISLFSKSKDIDSVLIRIFIFIIEEVVDITRMYLANQKKSTITKKALDEVLKFNKNFAKFLDLYSN